MQPMDQDGKNRKSAPRSLDIESLPLRAQLVKWAEGRDYLQSKEILLYGKDLVTALAHAMTQEPQMTTPETVFLAECLVYELFVQDPDYMALEIHRIDLNLLAIHGYRVFVFLVILRGEYDLILQGLDKSKHPILCDFLSQRVAALTAALDYNLRVRIHTDQLEEITEYLVALNKKSL